MELWREKGREKRKKKEKEKGKKNVPELGVARDDLGCFVGVIMIVRWCKNGNAVTIFIYN